MHKRVKQICEYGIIRNARDFPQHEDSPHTIFLDAGSFENLKSFVAENNDPAIEIEPVFSYHRQKGIDCIRVKNYVGVIETRRGTTIEILPKIYTGKEEVDGSSVNESRTLLLSMLRTLRDSPFKSIDKAHLNAHRMPLLEIFITMFVKEVESIVNRGIKHFYAHTEENRKFLKGRLLFGQQIRQNVARADRFFVSFDEFKANIPQNRVLKTALLFVGKKSKSTKNKSLIADILSLLEEVEVSKNIGSDLAKMEGHNRLFNYYDTAISWARLFLEGKSFTSYKGKHLNTAILFPMEVLFESYVAHQLKRQYPELNISTQDRQHYLLTDVLLKQNKFRIRPDIVVKNQLPIVADTKWKVLDENLAGKNYLISQADMYQLYAYGKKYVSNHLILIYPECETFTRELLFEYDEQISLRCVPWRFREENRVMG
ncbi:MAG TPA: McrC family protein [Prolixibacteraceae bacterium]|nr:McrC family protein [Prolixibacteraceae bacterium]